MKFFKRFSVIALIACTLVSCGSSKSTTSQGKKLVQKDKCEKLVYKQPEIRAWGHGAGFTIAEAIDDATLNARAKMASSIKATVEHIVGQASTLTSKGTRASGMGATSVQDREAMQGRSADSYAKETVSNTVEIENTIYELTDGTYECYVCIEYRQGVDLLTDGIINQVYQQISEEEKDQIENNLEDYRQRVRKQLGENNTK